MTAIAPEGCAPRELAPRQRAAAPAPVCILFVLAQVLGIFLFVVALALTMPSWNGFLGLAVLFGAGYALLIDRLLELSTAHWLVRVVSALGMALLWPALSLWLPIVARPSRIPTPSIRVMPGEPMKLATKVLPGCS